MKVTEIFEKRRQTFSFEFFPPKTEQGLVNLYKKMDQLAELRPDFCTVTCGAGGSNRGKTVEIADHCNRNMDCPAVVHVTCSWAAKAQIREMLDQTRELGMSNVMALRGDPPQGAGDFKSHVEGFTYAHELVQMIREEDYDFAIGVAGYPEGHVENPDREADLLHLKHKVEQGADFVATQLFFDNADFFSFVERCRAWTRRYSDGGEELYDVKADPLQRKNLADDPAHASAKAELKKRLPEKNAPHFGAPKKK